MLRLSLLYDCQETEHVKSSWRGKCGKEQVAGMSKCIMQREKINRKRTQGRKDIYPEPMCVVLQRPKLIAPWPTNPPQQLVILLSPAGPVEHSGPRQSSALQNLDPELWAELGCITTRATDTALPHNQSVCHSLRLPPSSSSFSPPPSCPCLENYFSWSLFNWPSWETCLHWSYRTTEAMHSFFFHDHHLFHLVMNPSWGKLRQAA